MMIAAIANTIVYTKFLRYIIGYLFPFVNLPVIGKLRKKSSPVGAIFYDCARFAYYKCSKFCQDFARVLCSAHFCVIIRC